MRAGAPNTVAYGLLTEGVAQDPALGVLKGGVDALQAAIDRAREQKDCVPRPRTITRRNAPRKQHTASLCAKRTGTDTGLSNYSDSAPKPRPCWTTKSVRPCMPTKWRRPLPPPTEALSRGTTRHRPRYPQGCSRHDGRAVAAHGGGQAAGRGHQAWEDKSVPLSCAGVRTQAGGQHYAVLKPGERGARQRRMSGMRAFDTF